MATSPASRERYAPEISPPLVIERTVIGSTVAMIEPTRAGGKAESDGTVPQIRPVKTMTVNEKRMGASGRNPTQPINQLADTVLLSTYAAAREMRMLATTTP